MARAYGLWPNGYGYGFVALSDMSGAYAQAHGWFAAPSCRATIPCYGYACHVIAAITMIHGRTFYG